MTTIMPMMKAMVMRPTDTNQNQYPLSSVTMALTVGGGM